MPPQCGSDGSQKDDFQDSLINSVRKLGEKEIVVTGGNFNNHVENNIKNMRTSMKVMVMELGTRKRKGFLSFVQL